MTSKKDVKLNILHNIYSVDRSIGGPIFSMSVIAENQAKLGHNVTIIAGQSKNHNNPVSFSKKIKLILIPCITKFRYMLNWSTNLLNLTEKPDIIHTYGIWTYHNYAAYKFAMKFGIPHIIAPCGMLVELGMRKSFFLKKIAWKIFQKEVLQNVSCFHAKSNRELKNISSIFPDLDIEIIPNPLSSAKKGQPINDNFFLDKYTKDKNILLYIGRLDEQKGIIDLIDAWDRLVLRNLGWCLVLAGHDENKGFLNDMLNRINKHSNINCLNLNNALSPVKDINLIITGPIYGEQKDITYRNSDLFINPSSFENFGMTIAEALSYNLPVIISKNTPWKLIEKQSCGWYLEEKNSNLYKILNKALKHTKLELKTMGLNSSAITKKFDKVKVSNDVLSLYYKYIVSC